MNVRVIYLSVLLCASVFAGENDGALQVEVIEELNFGSIKIAGVSGSISVSPYYPTLVNTTGGVYALSAATPSPSQLSVAGEPNTLVYLNIQNQATLQSTQGEYLQLSLELNERIRHLGVTGVIDDVYIGGTLSVDAQTKAGDYRGAFSISVDYQ